MTQIFQDTASLKEIEEIGKYGIASGVTTNQKIFLEKAKGCNFEKQAKKIIEMLYPLPVSLEGPNNLEDLVKTAVQYHIWGCLETPTYSNVVIKVPMMGNGDGLKAVKILSANGIKTNVTACMTLNQTFLAANAGATYVSLFYNRIKDWLKETMKCNESFAIITASNVIRETMNMLEKGNYATQLIVGSIRKPTDVEDIILANPDIITIPTKILKQMPYNDMTEKTLKEFDKAWIDFCKTEKKC